MHGNPSWWALEWAGNDRLLCLWKDMAAVFLYSVISVKIQVAVIERDYSLQWMILFDF